MNHDEKDDLWQLLGRAKTPEVSPFFSRNVLREVRVERQEQPSVWASLHQRWAMALLGTCAVATAAVGLLLHQNQPDQLALIASKVSASPDYQVISDLDDLLASEESSTWLDSSAY
jgi:hypothetical protein